MAASIVSSFPWFIQANTHSPLYLQAAKLLRLNGTLQFAFSTLFGTLLLLPMQRWFPLKVSGVAQKNFVAAHLDWYMLGFMQFCAATLILHDLPTTQENSQLVYTAAQLLAFGGWMNPTAYFFRGLGINAFEFAGSKLQMFCTSIGAVSASSIICGWGALLSIIMK